ncbi:anti-phage-associated DUF499 domain-containing protein [Sinorhizobium medicae]|uniref:anti-phage-associated DUF499 domain-containing protein n=1 Tax=Sinorhizobium medicae TaxID=110321 RepID=UPI000FD93C79|nr:anti-phage-associated DUF499 domain-containing protein [Sinorhizobium medicae]RVJ71441.1 DUF499 domain-containing protein [Sinorhizobium medicae]
MTYTRISTVKELCEPDPGALDFALSDQVEHLSDLLTEAEGAADDFFDKNFVTSGMERLLREGLQRLNGQSAQAVFELRQAMGGGKTHSMLALGLLARNPQLYGRVPGKITAGLKGEKARVVAIHGRAISPEHFLWGDIAEQLGSKEFFSKFWKHGADAPRENDWLQLIGDQPTLILLDELPPYFDFAVTQPVGGGTLANVTTYALSNLLSAAMKLPRTAIVVSNLVGSYQGATKELAKAIANIAEETKRQARSITPVDLNTDEIYDILRKRMFRKLPEAAEVEKIAEKFGEAITLAERSKTIQKSAEQIADEIIGSYPFHPSVKNIVALFKENENYRQTRGLMQFVSKMLKSVWQGEQTSDVYLVGCQHLDLRIADVREEIVKIGKLEGALSTDVTSTDGSAHAQVIDDAKGNNAATQAAKLLLTASLSESVDSIRGLNRNTLLEYLVVPDRSPSEFDEAFDELQRECWYLHKKENEVWYFSNIENLRKRIQNKADNAPIGKIEEEMKRRLTKAFEPVSKAAYQKVYALPKIDEIKLDATGRALLVMSPDSKTPPEAAKAFLDNETYKNAFCVVAGDGSSMGSLEDKTRRIWAIARVKAEIGSNPAHAAELEEEAETAEFDFSSAVTALFNRVYFPMPLSTDRTKAELKHAPLKLALEKNDGDVTIELNGEAAIEAALLSTAALKLVDDVVAKADSLMDRAENVLWPESQTRIPWNDVVTRAQSNARWLWLPPKGLEKLRDHAVSVGRWSYEGDGYVDKAPKKPKTTAAVIEESRNDATGEMRLKVHPMHAGKSPVIIVSQTSDLDKDGGPLEENPFSTTATKLWFRVSDPEGTHEQGDPTVWLNTLTLTHQPHFFGGKRTVELTVVPRGTIRWNTDGSNVKEGRVYDGPIELPGTEPVTVYAYAEDQGVAVEKVFQIAASAGEKIIDKNRQAKLTKEVKGETIAEAFKILEAAEANKGTLGAATISVGSGALNIIMRIGSDVTLKATDAKDLIAASRKALADENAEVKLGAKRIDFETGFGLEQFAKSVGEDVGPTDFDQS